MNLLPVPDCPSHTPVASTPEPAGVAAKVLGCQRGRAGGRQTGANGSPAPHLGGHVGPGMRRPRPGPARRTPGSVWERKFLQGLDAAGGAQHGARGRLDPWEGGSLAERP